MHVFTPVLAQESTALGAEEGLPTWTGQHQQQGCTRSLLTTTLSQGVGGLSQGHPLDPKALDFPPCSDVCWLGA